MRVIRLAPPLLDRNQPPDVQYSFRPADPQISQAGKPSKPVAGRGVLEHSLSNLVKREGQPMSSRFGVPEIEREPAL